MYYWTIAFGLSLCTQDTSIMRKLDQKPDGLKKLSIKSIAFLCLFFGCATVKQEHRNQQILKPPILTRHISNYLFFMENHINKS